MSDLSNEIDAAESLIAQLADEYGERLKRGERPDIEEYVQRWPGDPRVLRQVLASLQLVRISSTVGMADRAVEATDAAGQLGDFRLLRELGRGGMGVVYEAEQMSLGRRIALKILPFAGMLDPRQIQRFKNEALAVAQLDHPNIVDVLAVGCERGVHFYAMRLIDGMTLAEVIAELRNGSVVEEGLRGPSPQTSIFRTIASPRPNPGGADSGLRVSGIANRSVSANDGNGDASEDQCKMQIAKCKLQNGASESDDQAEGASFTEDLSPKTEDPSPKSQDRSPKTDREKSTVPIAGISSASAAEYYRSVARLMAEAADALDHAHQAGVVHRDVKPSNLMLDSRGKVWVTDFGLARVESNAEITMTGDMLGTLRYMSPEQASGNWRTVDHRTDVYSLGATLYELLTLRPAFTSTDRRELLRQLAEMEPIAPRRIRRSIPAHLETIARKAMEKEPSHRYASAAALAADLRHFLAGEPVRARPVGPRQRLVRWTQRHVRLVYFMTAALAVALLVGLAAAVAVYHSNQANDGASGIAPWQRSVAIDRAPFRHEAEPVPGSEERAVAPFSAELAKMHQQQWARRLDVDVEYKNSLGMRFVLIPPGEFTMGSTAAEIEEALDIAALDKYRQYWQQCIKSEAPQHKVVLTRPIFLGIHEVTQAEYETVTGTNPSYFAETGRDQQCVEKVAGLETSDYPVEGVSWNDAAEFCTKLSVQEGLEPVYSRSGETVTVREGTGYRLPSEAEWEFACRAGTTTKYWTGDADEGLLQAAWFGANSGGRTHTVGELKANPFGLCDVHGNVREWVQDWNGTDYYEQFQERSAIDPTGPSSPALSRVLRGGSWYDVPSSCRASHRFAFTPSHRDSHHFGFRVSLPVAAVGSARIAEKNRGIEPQETQAAAISLQSSP